jgi:hypothetical protein
MGTEIKIVCAGEEKQQTTAMLRDLISFLIILKKKHLINFNPWA